MKSLIELYKSHQGKISDKWEIYLREYDRLFTSYRDKTISLLEIGVQNGGSLEIFSNYFTNGKKFIGCDLNKDCGKLSFEDPRITVVVGDANQDVTQNKIISHSESFDLIIDDGSHFSGDIFKSFIRYFPMLNHDGLFIVEDLHCSYFHEFEGGLYYPFSSIELFKRFVDLLNYQYLGVDKKRTDLIKGFGLHYNIEISEDTLSQIYSVEFTNSLCVIRKKQNNLTNRVITGKEYPVNADILKLDKHFVTPPQNNNFWSTLESSPMELYEKKIIELAAKDKKIAEYNLLVAEHSQIISSWSWKCTRPLRFIFSFVKKFFRKLLKIQFNKEN